MSYRPLRIRAALFDFDGTLTQPGALDFDQIRAALGCPPGIPILEFIDGLAEPSAQAAARMILHQMELQAAAQSVPNHGAEDLIAFLREKQIKIGIVSRNSRKAIEVALKNFTRTLPHDFDVIISRDDCSQPKPKPDSILLAAQRLGINPAETVVVGDYFFDIEAGRAAGSPTVFLNNRNLTLPDNCPSTFTIADLAELRGIIELGLPLAQGKLPHHFLRTFLKGTPSSDTEVLVWPAIGEDTAAVDIVREEVIVLKSDPITFVTESIGQYAVLVNANDIATAGARPRWFLTSLLFPPGTTPDAIQLLMQELAQTCSRWGISLCGGHTEITDAVTRPVVTGTLVGTVAKKDLLEKRNIRPGDILIMTKAAGIEGTAIIARECPTLLRRAGMTDEEIETCTSYLNQISILQEASIAACTQGVCAMHDVTEGGIVTAISELSEASKCKIKVHCDRIVVYPLTRKVCTHLGINPLGLIGSGCLLICCREGAVEQLCRKFLAADIPCAPIGEVIEYGTGVEAFVAGKPVKWPHFEVDELARLFHNLAEEQKKG